MLLRNLQRLDAGKVSRQDLQDVRLEAQSHQARNRNSDDQKQDEDEPDPVKHPATLRPACGSAILSWVEDDRHLV